MGWFQECNNSSTPEHLLIQPIIEKNQIIKATWLFNKFIFIQQVFIACLLCDRHVLVLNRNRKYIWQNFTPILRKISLEGDSFTKSNVLIKNRTNTIFNAETWEAFSFVPIKKMSVLGVLATGSTLKYEIYKKLHRKVSYFLLFKMK